MNSMSQFTDKIASHQFVHRPHTARRGGGTALLFKGTMKSITFNIDFLGFRTPGKSRQ